MADAEVLLARGVSKRFHDYVALQDADISMGAGEVVALLGPSGSGKTTLLRCVAGLEDPEEGQIVISGQTVFDAERRQMQPAEKRNLGYVFQSYALWPHMSVLDNVAYGLRVRGARRQECREKATEMLGIVGLHGRAERYPGTLSGGEQQRVALARSLVTSPKVLLLDEPLSNLDRAVREEMREYLMRIVKEVGISTLLVTHDHGEALSMADNVYVMNRGRIVESGAPDEIYSRPESEFAARFLGIANVLPLRDLDHESGIGVCVTNERPLRIDARGEADRWAALIRPEDIRSATGDGGGTSASGSTVEVVVKERFFLGNWTEYTLDWAGAPLRMLSTDQDLEVGRTVGVSLPVGHLVRAPAPHDETAVGPHDSRTTA